MQKKRLPIGVSDFKKLKENNYYYVDKSAFIREIIEASAEIILLPRPRRFGKTLNLNMLKRFFEKSAEDVKPLFKGLVIEKAPCFDEHQGKYPVIWLTLKDIKESSWEFCFRRLMILIQSEFERHEYLLNGNALQKRERAFIKSVLEDTAKPPDYADALLFLSKCLYKYHARPVVILIDEYDSPLHAGYANGYYEEIIGFIRNFLSGGLKDNPHLLKGVLTGILRVAKESVFSGLNNLGVYTILDQEFNDSFGFTEKDTRGLLQDYDMADRFDEAARWYDGYLFGGRTIYNPWSLINYANSRSGKPKPFWINTADTALIDRLVTGGGRQIREEIGRLLEGRTIERPVFETIVMRDLDIRDDLLWSFLLFSGYLKPAGEAVRRNLHPLAIPNKEVRLAYEELVIRWFAEKTESACLIDMLDALSGGDTHLFERLLRKIVSQVMSCHDFGNEPEKVYHALVLGMLVWLDGQYDIRSNRESGYGRYDIMLKPKNSKRTGIIIEFKRVEKKAEDAYKTVLKDALKQIEERGYAAELQASGITDILEIAVAFKGKKLWMKHRKTPQSK